MKKLIGLFLTMTLCLSLSACSDGSTVITENEDGSVTVTTTPDERIKCVYDQGLQDIFVDDETGVMYLFVKSGYGGGLTVMLDAEGNPLLWEG